MADPPEIPFSPMLEARQAQDCKPMNLTKHPYACSPPSPKQAQTWFDIKVFYVRVSTCLPTEVPDSLLLAYPPRHIHTELEVNGARISPSERACFTLRKDRVDSGSSEATYVSTNNIRTTGDLPFEIHDKDELLIHGTLSKADTSNSDDHRLHHQALEGHGSVSSFDGSIVNEARWSMDCCCGITSPTCSFLRGRVDFSPVSPFMEVYMAGRSHGLPIVLTQTVQLILRKKSLRYCTLDVIQEDEESVSSQIVAGQVADEAAYAKFANQSMALGMPRSFYFSDGMADGGFGEGEGELSWFNAGVRVGVGIGLGLCLGVGVGVGLLMRTYHATTGPFRRRRFL